jgi:hypothetical protein
MAPASQRRGAPDPWHGRQPRYEKLVATGPTGFALVTRLPNGTPVHVALGPARRRSS